MRFFAVSAIFVSAISSALGASLYLVGDSTMASHKASEGIEGWGVPLNNYLTGITLVNRAVSGRSARSYWREGKWAAVQASLKSGDLIEFGHNDGGSPSTSDRASVLGEGSETQKVTLSDGTVETVYTWPTYIKWMIDGAKSKGATAIISSTTPNNPFEGVSKINYTPGRFVTYAKNAAAAKGVPYVDHFTASLLNYDKLGKAVTESYFPNDHTHTNAAGANAVAWAFLSALRCPSAKGALSQYV
ncbi:Rhamnogalacturonan acetylesterase OS=Aspergillus aculeatus GN=rha1 PE=1 SV=1 [Rhizoctonia solani AG-1 IB]|uniref:Rhamnogalacturonan acetylesterase n=1 Tax=Thanatephorus cucumeris (strain AG1-IB / isolate 7/3/14) TaxID=1108050 RepID=A0A0B7FJF2_THACB|nr:Rhamnogalacturonan acetylesterase OS=Aspergillus aculeatus GN=rha1 PE=1 SV=1 [Rhizoctonia solani AG-1 IB]